MDDKQMSKEMKNYFQEIDKKLKKAYDIANKARKKGLDPEDKAPIPLAKNLAERVEGLISAVAPQILNCGISKRIAELEKKYGVLDWRIALTIAEEIANEKFCKFKNKLEAITTGIRVGFAYLTLGTVASPLEGLVEIKIGKTFTNKEYFVIFYSGPIRSAGGTAAAVSVILTDYLRKKFGYAAYDPTEKEIQRMVTEIYDYHERITNLQYKPSQEEIKFLVKHLPVQINGDPSEKIEVSNYKDLERIETNRVRNGPCLVIAECLAQKATKLWTQISKWMNDFKLEHWSFLGEFVELQKRVKSKGETQGDKQKINPVYTYIQDLVAGRPVLTHPLRPGGFRLRYGRCRNSGYSSACINPLTTLVLNRYIAIGTQLKVERPGKATAISVCDSIEGPVVKLKDGSTIRIETEQKAKEVQAHIEKILYLGDILFNYGDFYNRAHPLLPVGYCEEWWIQELEKATVNLFGTLDIEKLSGFVEVPTEAIRILLKDPFYSKLRASTSIKLSEKLNIPLYPRYTYHWKNLSSDDVLLLANNIEKMKVIREEGKENNIQKIILPLEQKLKKALEIIGLPHSIATEYIVVEKDDALAFVYSLGLTKKDAKEVKQIIEDNIEKNPLTIVNILSEIKIRDKSGTFIGARMGRPEKAKIRKLTGSPHVLFPVGAEGGKLRCFQSALEVGKIRADFPLYKCNKCNKETIYAICECEDCNKKTKKAYYCKTCGLIEKAECKHGKAATFKTREIDIKHYFNTSLKKLKIKTYPDLIKGVRGTSNKDHIPENLIKGILRAKHAIFVNKDGTTRYDMTQLALTHFKPKEVGTSLEKLKEIGYEKDIDNKPLENPNQVLELKPQDLILPSCNQSVEEGADKILFRVSKFIDDCLKYFYDTKPFYNLKSEGDLVGHLVVALAPHTSAGIVGRIIGFSKTQGFYAHPMFHAATRRDCLDYNTFIPIYDGIKWKNVKIGEFIEKLNPTEKVDNFGTLGKMVSGYYTFSFNKIKTKLELTEIKEFTKHSPVDFIEITTEAGRTLKCTIGHKLHVLEDSELKLKKAIDLKKDDVLVLPLTYQVRERDITKINLEEYFKEEYIMIRNISPFVKKIINKLGQKKVKAKLKLSRHDLYNYVSRDSFPIKFLIKLLELDNKSLKDLPQKRKLAIKRDNIAIPHEILLNNDVLEIVGLYVAEGFARKNISKKSFYQISIAATEKEVRQKIKRTFKKYFNLEPSEYHEDHLTYSSRLLYEFFIDILEVGRNAFEKRIPPLFFSLPKKKIASFLRGYFDGDGSVSPTQLRISCDTVSEGLFYDLAFLFALFDIFIKRYDYRKKPGPAVRKFYIQKEKNIPTFKITKAIIQSNFFNKFAANIGFSLKRKKRILKLLQKKNPKGMKILNNKKFIYPKIKKIQFLNKKRSYCINLKNHNLLANNLLVHNCDGDEASVMLLLDSLINFSRQFLPNSRGATQDAPLVLTSKLTPAELDDMVFDLDVVWKYPLEFYELCSNYKYPWDIEIENLGKRLNTEKQYEKIGFTHPTKDINAGVKCSAYKLLPSMEEKLKGQMDLAEKINAVDETDVARLVIEKHFLRDIRGNLRKFSQQEFRCVMCNEKYRRPPLIGKCIKCGGRIIFTISQGSIIKYLEPAISLAEKYNVPAYLKQTLELTKRHVECVFGREKEKQIGLGKWFG